MLVLEQAVHFQSWTRPVFEAELQHPGAVGHVALASGVLAGFVLGWAVLDELHLHDLVVAPEQRRRGLGRLLLAAFAASGRRTWARRILLDVRASNVPALAFYRRCGFEVAGCRPDYYDFPKEDGLLMTADPVQVLGICEGSETGGNR